MKQDIEKRKYEFALQRIEALLPQVEDTEEGVSGPEGVELMIMSEIVEAYEKEHFPIGKPSIADLIQLSLEEKGLTQERMSGLAGIARSHLAALENGEKTAKLNTLWNIAYALDLKPSELIRMVEKETESKYLTIGKLDLHRTTLSLC